MNISPDNSIRLQSALRFLALNNAGKMTYLGSLPDTTEFVDLDNSFVSHKTTKASLIACSRIIDGSLNNVPADNRDLLLEIGCLIDMMLTLAESVIDYHLTLDKEAVPVSGPLDYSWAIAERLAQQVLKSAPGQTGLISCVALLESGGLRIRK